MNDEQNKDENISDKNADNDAVAPATASVHSQAEAVESEVLEDDEKLKLECAEYKMGWQRAVADYQNLQKEVRERQHLWIQLSEQQILEEFIPVYDNFKKAFNHKEQGERNKEQDSWKMGIGFIMKQFGDILKAHNIEEIKTVGEKFDPKFHESVGEASEPEPSGSVHGNIESGMIVKEVDGGYTLNGRIIKAAKVIVMK